MTEIVAKKWWREHSPKFPFTIVTTKKSNHNPQSIDQLFKDNNENPLHYITVGMLDGNRIWAFAEAANRTRFVMKIRKDDIVNYDVKV